ncbi:MAG: amidohydrolase [Chloroflexi bacterium]|nr:amidohydrolase [Chloroflexota bacterium]
MFEPAHPFISGDSHLEVDSKNWITRVPEKYRDRAPRVIRLPDGGDAWLVEGQPLRQNAADIYGGKGREVWRPTGQQYETTPGTGPGSQRLKEQDMDGVSAEVLFPAVGAGPSLWRSIKDNAAYLSVIQAYNSWLAEDYCSEDPNRLIGVGALPQTGKVDDVIAEMERCLKLGLRTVALGAFPSGKPYPMPEDDKFYGAVVDQGVPLTIHVQLSRRADAPLFNYAREPEGGAGRGIVGQLAHDKFCRLGGVNAVQLMFAGVFDRFPTLKIDFAENQIGWLAHFYEQAEERYDRHWFWGELLQGMKPLERRPIEYLREHCYWGFQGDRAGVEMRDRMRTDRVIWASDFPHQESDWPESRKTLERNFTGIPADDTFKMVVGNAVEFFKLQDCYAAWEGK